MVKLASNALLATKITFINEIASGDVTDAPGPTASGAVLAGQSSSCTPEQGWPAACNTSAIASAQAAADSRSKVGALIRATG